MLPSVKSPKLVINTSPTISANPSMIKPIPKKLIGIIFAPYAKIIKLTTPNVPNINVPGTFISNKNYFTHYFFQRVM